MAVTGAILVRVRPRPHARQPAALPRARGDQRTTASSCASCSTAPASGSPGRSCSSRSSCTSGRRTSLTLDQPPRAPERLPRGKVEGVDLRLAHHALGRRHPAALRHLPPAALHDRAPCTRASSKATSTTTSSRASASSRSRPSTSSRCSPSGCTCATASGACSRRWAFRIRATSAMAHVAGLDLRGGRRDRQHLLPPGGARRDREVGEETPWSSKSNVPSGPLEKKWDRHRFEMKLVNPANKRKYTVIMVGSGLAGAGGAASLAELGYNVKCFCYQDSPAPRALDRRPGRHQRGQELPATTATASTACSTTPSRAATSAPARPTSTAWPRCRSTSSTSASRRACPFAREYGGLLDNRSFGGAQVSRTFYARGQTGQQLLLGAYQALERQIGLGQVEMYSAPRDAGPDRRRRPRPRHRRARPGHRRGRDPLGRRRVLGDRRLRQRLLPLDQRQGLQRHGDLARLQEGRRASPTPASRRSTRPASRSPASTSPS